MRNDLTTCRAGGAPTKKIAYVYLLQSRCDGTSYVGWTTDILRRLAEHNEHLSGYTRRKAPWQLMGFETYPTVEEAKRRERALKRNPRMLALFKKRLLSRTAYGRPRQVVG
ncbi:MAG: GIY-YIG nuclease family protein [Candidatus Omnitrophica bacterium]|nr:GIY-YIG nuclease family protein [Candidatus Omnitrophota bacterium]